MNSKTKSAVFQSFSQWVGMGQSLITDLDKQHLRDSATLNVLKELKNSMNSIQSCRDRILGAFESKEEIDPDDLESESSSTISALSSDSSSASSSASSSDSSSASGSVLASIMNDKMPIQLVINPWHVNKIIYNQHIN